MPDACPPGGGPVSCRQAALRFLKIRPRSIFELQGKLQDKGFTSEDIQAAVRYLLDIKLLDDRAFTVSWIQYRLARPFGFRRICRELKDKGVAQELIDQSIEEVKGEYSEASVVFELAQRKAQRLMGIDPQKRKKRIFDFLIRRGFPVDMAMKAIKKV